MADAFDDFLGSALAPPQRLPDRAFVAAVQARIRIEERLAGERRALFGALFRQLLALLAVAAAVCVVGRAAPVSVWFAQSPAIVVLVLLTGFASLVILLSARAGAIGPVMHLAVPEH